MKTRIALGLLFVLLFLGSSHVTTARASGNKTQPRVTFDPPPLGPDGKPMMHVTVHTGHGGPDSAPHPSAFFVGHLHGRSPADSMLYVFLLDTAQDTTVLQNLLATYREKKRQSPRLNVRAVAAGQKTYASLVSFGSLLRIPVNAAGVFIFDVENERKHLMSVVDTEGKVAAQRPIWKE